MNKPKDLVETRIPWLQQIPKHWELSKFGFVLQERGEVNKDGKVSEVLSVLRTRGVIPYNEKGNIGNKKSEDITRYKIVRKGDIVMNSMNVIIGSVGLSEFEGCLSPVYYVLKNRSQKNNIHYLNYYCQTKSFQHSLTRLGNGILAHRMRIPMELLKHEPFPLPPLEEQNAIVRYLDYMDNLIKRYIRVKQKQIKLLNEQKQAIIDLVVTNGLELHPTLIPTGNVWLDFIPKGWQFLPLKRWVSTKITDGPHETPELIDFGVPFLSAESMVNGHLDFNHKRGYISQKTHEYFCKKCHPRKDDIFICKSGATTGKVVIVETDQEFSVWSPLALIRVNPKKVLPQLLFFILQSTYVQQQVQTKWSFGTQQNLSMAAMERIQIALPSHEEQLELYAQITELLTNLEIIIQKINNEVELMHDYRKRLIADVVVGKLDVYEAAAHLPVEILVLDQVEEVQLGDGDFEDVETELEGGEQ